MSGASQKIGVSQVLIDFIRFSLKEGIPLEDIEDSLREEGHDETEISAALSQAFKPMSMALPTGPAARSAETGEEKERSCPEIEIEEFRTPSEMTARPRFAAFGASGVKLMASHGVHRRPSLEKFRKEERIRLLFVRLKNKRAEKRRRRRLALARAVAIAGLALVSGLLYLWLK